MACQMLRLAALLAGALGVAVADMSSGEAAQVTQATGAHTPPHLRGAAEPRRRLEGLASVSAAGAAATEPPRVVIAEETSRVATAFASAFGALASQGQVAASGIAAGISVTEASGATPGLTAGSTMQEATDDEASLQDGPITDLSQAFHVLAQVLHKPVLVGDLLHIGSLFQGSAWQSYLDVTPGNCEGNQACVSAAASSDRDQGSGTWQIALAGSLGYRPGQVLESGHLVHIKSAYRGPEGQNFLDTRNMGCESSRHCVSASSSPDRDAGSGSWEIVRAEGPGPINYGDKVYIRNKYSGLPGLANSYLDVNQQGCEGNRDCVSASGKQNRDRESGSWRFMPAFV